MHPAPSLILFTSVSGAGFGLLALLGGLAAAGWLRDDAALAGVGLSLGLILVAAGLLSSTFHLRHPERAWRALTQWRSSWLSREGVLAVVTFPPALALWAHALFGVGGDRLGVVAGLATALAALATVHCTAMIYASLRPVRHWYDPWVPVVFQAFALAGGALLLYAVAATLGRGGTGLWLLAVIALGLAMVAQAGYRRSIAAAPPAPARGSLLGLDAGVRVHALDPPHTGSNYLLREMAWVVGRRHARRLRRLALLVGGAATMVVLALSVLVPPVQGAVLAWVAVCTAAIGVLVVRWLFFAEAEHTVQLYYFAPALERGP
jgi:sulfite dehydrogenase (quinone) subunit SoeC